MPEYHSTVQAMDEYYDRVYDQQQLKNRLLGRLIARGSGNSIWNDAARRFADFEDVVWEVQSGVWIDEQFDDLHAEHQAALHQQVESLQSARTAALEEYCYLTDKLAQHAPSDDQESTLERVYELDDALSNYEDRISDIENRIEH